MKILSISGSPREGNTESMLNVILNSAKESGAETKLISLKDLKLGLCKGDQSCSDTKKCIISDDMDVLVGEIKDADVLLIGSPCYFNNVTANLKVFFDRSNPQYESQAWKGKKVAVVMVGAMEQSAKKGIEVLEDFCVIHGMKVIESYVAEGEKIGEVESNSEVMTELKAIGERLANG
jgi:multimeric flavodoxin WrbA